MILVNKETLETYQPHQVAEMNPHIMFDFSGAGLADSEYAIVYMPNQPVFDTRYQVANVGEVIESEGVYSSEWVLSPVDLPLQELAAMKAAEIGSACETEILSGFYSDAIGSMHFYSCDRDAQMNIQANLIASLAGIDVMHYCTDSNGARAKRLHTVGQMRELGLSMGAHIWPKLDKANDLRLEIEAAVAANDITSLIAIKW